MSALALMWTWWSSIVFINVFNLIIGILIFVKSMKSKNDSSYKKRMRIAGIIFIGVAFYRSIFVSSYFEQLAWFDTIFNSSFVIRSFAFFAEISFAYLIMRMLLKVSEDVPMSEEHKTNKIIVFLETNAPYIFFVLLIIAQPFAYGGMINKMYLLFAIEETFWGIAFLLITPLLIIQLRRVYSFKDEQTKKELKMYRIFTVFMTVFSVGYSFYSVFYHLPIEYWPQAIEQLQMINPEPAIKYGFNAIKDSFNIINVTHNYDTWGGIGFIIWHSGYFTLCGWMVLFFMSGPEMKKQIKK